MNNRIDIATSPFPSRESSPAPVRYQPQTFIKKHGMKLLTIPLGLTIGGIGYGINKLRQKQEQQRLQNERVRKPIMHTIY